MLKFFRKIRQNLLSENLFSKYLLYAIGEIILVVIGILIALSINHLYQEMKTNKFEEKLLTELYNIIVEDISEVEFLILQNEVCQSSCETILSHFDKKISYHDSLDMHFQKANNWYTLILRKSAFDNAKSYGLHFIKDDSTRFLLTNLYEYSVTWSKTMDSRQTLYYYNTVVPKITELFETTSSPYVFKRGVVPNDFEALRNDKIYRNILKSNIRNRGYENDWLGYVLNGMRELAQKLEIEIRNN